MPYLGRDTFENEKGAYYSVDDISSQFDGVKTSFDLRFNGGNILNIGFENALEIFINNVRQEPKVSYNLVSGSTIEFVDPPQTGDSFWGVLLGTASDTKVYSPNIEFTATDKNFSVGANGDFPDLITAFREVSKKYNPIVKVDGNTSKVTLNILSGHVIDYQMALENIDLSWITITGDDAQTTIDDSSFALVDGSNPFIYGNNAKLPVISQGFAKTGSASTPVFLVLKKSSARIITNKTFSGSWEYFVRGVDEPGGSYLYIDGATINGVTSGVHITGDIFLYNTDITFSNSAGTPYGIVCIDGVIQIINGSVIESPVNTNYTAYNITCRGAVGKIENTALSGNGVGVGVNYGSIYVNNATFASMYRCLVAGQRGNIASYNNTFNSTSDVDLFVFNGGEIWSPNGTANVTKNNLTSSGIIYG